MNDKPLLPEVISVTAITVGRFRIQDNVPTEFVAKLQGQLLLIDPFLPDWVEYINVYHSTVLGSAAAEITSRYDYRRASLELAPTFFAEKDVQMEVLLHEVCHVIQEPLWDMVRNMRSRLKDLSPDKTADELMGELLRHTREQTVCDMTKTLMKLMGKPIPAQVSRITGC